PHMTGFFLSISVTPLSQPSAHFAVLGSTLYPSTDNSALPSPGQKSRQNTHAPRRKAGICALPCFLAQTDDRQTQATPPWCTAAPRKFSFRARRQTDTGTGHDPA